MSYQEVAEALGAGPVRIVGSRTKIGWGRATEPVRELSTRSLDRIIEHNEGDLTAVLQAGVRLRDAQAKFAEAGQMLALDPPDPGGEATIGGVVAAGDSGPLRHRYGAARDLVLGVTVALPDGTVARAGGKVIKNVAGYDLAKLFAGSFGTLGAIVEVAVRLHPLRPTASGMGDSDDPDRLAAAAATLAHSRLEAQALEIVWWGGRGGVFASFAGSEAGSQAQVAQRLLADAGLSAQAMSGADYLLDEQRMGQRGHFVVRVSALQTQLADVLRAAERHGARVVGRAALGISYLSLPKTAGVEAITDLRTALAPATCVVLDAPADIRAQVDPWDLQPDAPATRLMRATKARFDPGGVLAPGVLLSESEPAQTA